MILEVKDGCFGYFGQPVIFDHINLSLEKDTFLQFSARTASAKRRCLNA